MGGYSKGGNKDGMVSLLHIYNISVNVVIALNYLL